MANITLLPATSLETDRYDLVFHDLALYDIGKYAPTLFPSKNPKKGSQYDWQIYKALANRINQRKVPFIKKLIINWSGLDRLLNPALLSGSHGKWKKGRFSFSKLGLSKLQKHPNDTDLGISKPSLPKQLYTPDKIIDLVPKVITEDMSRVEKVSFTTAAIDKNIFNLALLDLRHLRNNTPWRHNITPWKNHYFLRKIFFCTYFFFSTCFLIGQGLNFQHFTMADGLSDSGTIYNNCILQDKEGFLWFATFNGINRFDGEKFKRFQFSPADSNSLADNLCTSLCAGEDGKIWISTGGNGITIFDPETENFEHIRHDPTDPNSLCCDLFNFISKDKDGNMWLGTRLNKLCYWSKLANKFISFENQIYDADVFFQQKDGTIWIGNYRGLYKKVADSLTFRHIPIPNGGLGMPFSRIKDICEIPNDKLLLANGQKAFWEFDTNTETFRDMNHLSKTGEAPTCLLKDKDGYIWLGFQGEIQKFDPILKTIKGISSDTDNEANLPPYNVIFGIQDKAGSVWFNDDNSGVFVIHTTDSPFKVIGNSWSRNILPIGGNKFVLNSADGIHFFDTNAENITIEALAPGILNMRAYSMALSGDNDLWLMDENTKEAKIYNLDTKQLTSLSGRIAWLDNDLNGKIWNALKYYDTANKQWVDMLPVFSAAFPDFIDKAGRSEDIYFNDKNSIWIGTDIGLFHYNFNEKRGKHYRHNQNDPNSIASDVIHLIYPGQKGSFYIWTTSGMSIYKPDTDDFQNYYESNGLLHNAIQTLIEDNNGNPWIGTKKGLQMLDLKTNKFTNYTVMDGLPSNQINYHLAAKDNNGNIYMAIGGKLTQFHPDSIPKRNDTAPVYLLDFFLNNKVVKTGDKNAIFQKQLRFINRIDLNYKQVDFGFNFVMPVFYKSKEIEYFYKLSPYQKEWQANGTNNEVHYTNINPGKYTFSVKAKSASGAWSVNEASVQITIKPPWWKT